LFTIAIATALREGDICTLKWSEIDFRRDLIIKRMRKTDNIVEIPIMPPLRDYLLQHNNISESEYVLPQHAEMYLNNSSGVSYRIKQFLENKCNIATTKKLEGRSRAVSVKDLHSCRHSFCYYAGLYGIPLSIVQSIVGHMTPEMTKHYSAHASLSAKREQMRQLPEFMMLSSNETRDFEAADREELQALISTLPIEKVRQLLEELR
jgi:integrase